jgi:hypothetical protein
MRVRWSGIWSSVAEHTPEIARFGIIWWRSNPAASHRHPKTRQRAPIHAAWTQVILINSTPHSQETPIKMPHSVSSDSSEDIAMADVAEDCSGKTQNDPGGLARETADEIHDTSDKENRNSLEDMFDDDSDDDDEFPSSAPAAHGDDNSQQERSAVSTRLCLDLL